jgi:hypothetical protein
MGSFFLKSGTVFVGWRKQLSAFLSLASKERYENKKKFVSL